MRSPTHLLRAVTELVSLRTDPGPFLFGVDTAADTLRLHPVPLDPADPIADLETLVAPAEWDLVVVSLDAVLRRLATCGDRALTPARVTHGVTRGGGSATRTEPALTSATLSAICGPLQRACEQVLADAARVVP